MKREGTKRHRMCSDSSIVEERTSSYTGARDGKEETDKFVI